MRRLLLILWLLAVSDGLRAEQTVLQLVADRWPPFNDQRLPGDGLMVQLSREALQRAGYSIRYTELPWARALRGVRLGEYDILVGAWHSLERESFGLFSDAVLDNRLRLLQRQGETVRFSSLDDLRPYRIAVVRGYSYGAAFDEHPALQRVAVRDFPTGLRMLLAGRVDLAVEDEWVARLHLAGELREQAANLAFVPGTLSEKPLFLLASRKHPQHRQIIAAFNQALAAMRVDGSYATLLQRHGLSEPVPLPEDH